METSRLINRLAPGRGGSSIYSHHNCLRAFTRLFYVRSPPINSTYLSQSSLKLSAKENVLCCVNRRRPLRRRGLNVVDFFNVTSALWKAHPGFTSGGRVNDCTHYCTNVGGAVHHMSVLLLRSL